MIDAVKAARNAIKELKAEREAIKNGKQSELSGSAKDTERALNNVFKDSSNATAGRVDSMLSAEQSILEDTGEHYNYKMMASDVSTLPNGHVSVTLGSAFPGDNTINLTPEFFSASDRDEQQTLAHEPNHINYANAKPVQTETYGSAIKGLTRSQSLNNADSYAQFVVP